VACEGTQVERSLPLRCLYSTFELIDTDHAGEVDQRPGD
jgi:hypothetical protein